MHSISGQTGEMHVFIDYWIDGGDTIFVEYPDTSEIELRMPPDPDQISIGVSPTATIGGIQPGLYGIHIGGMYTQSHMPQGSFGGDQWNLLSDLRPEVLRFPSGANSTFMHLLHHPTLDTDSNGIRDRSKGYGFVAEEIIRYYDFTDGVIDLTVLDELILDAILMVDDFDVAIVEWTDPVTGWMEDEKLAGDCFGDLEDYKEQLLLSPDESYIDDFLQMVEQIETANGGDYRIKVIVCLNIASETAEEGRAIVEYLRDNAIYNVEVYGVELGNECYNRFYTSAMGFDGFTDYYRYLHGDSVSGIDLNELLREDMQDEGHDFIQTFKGDSAFNCLVSVAAYDTPGNETEYALRAAELEWMPDADWNDSIAQFYDDTVHVAGLAEPNPAFDAVVIHPYYGINNYQDAMLDSIAPLLASTYICDETPSDTIWRFSPIDTRLDSAFDYMSTKYISLFRSEFKESFDRWGVNLQFTDPELFNKEIWLTEWNFKDKGNGILPVDENRMEVYSNTFLQGAMVLEWNMKHAKMNFQPGYADGFLTIAGIHSYGGGDNTSMLHVASGQELQYYDDNPQPWMELDLCNDSLWFAPGNPNRRNYFVPGTPYYSEELIRIVFEKDLRYVKTNFGVAAAFVAENLQPTVLIDPGYDTLYFVYSNIRGHKQNYALNPYGLLPLYPGASDISIGDKEMIYVQADATCSTAGWNSLYDLNTCYSPKNAPDSCNGAAATTPFPMEITGYQDSVLAPNCPGSIPANRCITVPPYSYGIIQIPISPIIGGRETSIVPKGEALIIYPNPTSETIYIQLSDNGIGETISICNTLGNEVMVIAVNNQSVIEQDVSLLSSGVYYVTTRTSGNMVLTGKFIKQ